LREEEGFESVYSFVLHANRVPRKEGVQVLSGSQDSTRKKRGFLQVWQIIEGSTQLEQEEGNVGRQKKELRQNTSFLGEQPMLEKLVYPRPVGRVEPISTARIVFHD